MAGKNVCHYEKYGYCKKKEACPYFHPSEVCKKEFCDVKVCTFRHPKPCRFFAIGICKFLDSCRYDHKKVVDCETQVEKLKDIEMKFDKLKKLYENQDNIIKVLKEKIQSLESNVIPALHEVIAKVQEKKEKKRKRLKNSGNENGTNLEDESVLDESLNKRNKKDEINETSTSCETSMNVDEDDSIFEDMTYKNILEKEFEITSNLEKMFTDVANNLKYKKINETRSLLKNIEIVVDENKMEMEKLEPFHRHKDTEDNNSYKILELVKKSIKMFEKLANNKFRRITEIEIDKIVEELKSVQNDKKSMLIGIYDAVC